MKLRILYVPQLYPLTTSKVGSISSINMIFDYARKFKDVWTDFWIPAGYDLAVFEANKDKPIGYTNAIKLGLKQTNTYRGKWVYGVDLDLEMALRKNMLDYDLILFEQGYHLDYYAFVNFERPWGMNVPTKVPMAAYVTDGLFDNNLYQLKDRVGQFTLMKSYALFPYLFATKYDREGCLREASKFIVKRGFGNDAYIFKPSVDFQEIKRERRVAGDKITFLHAGETMPSNNPHVLADALEEISPAVPDKFDYKIMSRSIKEEYDKRTTKSFTKQLYGATRAEFQKELYSCHVMWVGTEYAAAGLAFWEAIASGMLPLFWNKKWQKDRRPEWYPLVANNETELRNMLIMITKNYDKLYAEYADRLYDWYRKEMDTNVLVDEGRAILEKVTVKQFEDNELPDNYVVKMMRDIKISEGTYEQIGQAVKAESDKKIDILEVLSFPARRMFLRKAGWDDTVLKGTSYWVKNADHTQPLKE